MSCYHLEPMGGLKKGSEVGKKYTKMLGLGKKSWQLKHKQADQWAVWQRAPEENTLEA